MPNDDHGERIARLEERMEALRQDHTELYEIVNARDTGVRPRLHRLENDSAAAKAAEAALTAARAMRDQGWSRSQKLTALAVAIGALALQLTGYHI